MFALEMNQPAESDYPRPLGVHGAPHIGDTPELFRLSAEPRTTALPDLSLEATPAAEDLRNALSILAPCGESLINDAVTRLIKSALAKIERGERVTG